MIMVDKKMVFCTLFDSNYLDKGIALINSLNRVCEKFSLYVLAFDDNTEKILKHINFSNVIIISLKSFETAELLTLKGVRTRAEYCYTCTSFLIEYVFNKYCADYCTYIDADMYFYDSPEVLLDEFIRSKASVGLTKHAFPKTVHGEWLLKKSGKYCVEFNTFKNDVGGRRLLNIWKNQCIEECSVENYGDQLYLTNWGDKYPEVYDYQNLGAGVAPWNLSNYKVSGNFPKLEIENKGKKYHIIFYHFEGIAYSGNGRIDMNVLSWIDNGFIQRKTIRKIYYPYLIEIEKIRLYLLKTYNFSTYGGRKYDPVKFELNKFIKAMVDRIKQKKYFEVVDMMARVIKKKQNIVSIKRD